MFCAKCGKKIDDDSTFCPYCGQKVDAPVKPGRPSGGGSKKAAASVSLNNKMPLIGIAVAFIAVVAVIFGVVKLIGGSKFKTPIEKIFAMSWEESSETAVSDIKAMFNEEGILYESDESDYYGESVGIRTPDTFMGNDCLFGYIERGMDWDCGWESDNTLHTTVYGIAYETTDDFKKGRKELENYLSKELIKNSQIISVNRNDADNNTLYVIEESDKNIQAFVENGIRAEELTEEEKEELGNSHVFKFVQVCYTGSDNSQYFETSYFTGDKSYIDYMCEICVCYTLMSQEDYISFMAGYGYDAVRGKGIDIEGFRESVGDAFIESLDMEDKVSGYSSEKRKEYEKSLYSRLYMMEEYNFDTDSGLYFETDEEKQLWYIKNYGWDADAESELDLSDYRDSADIYCAVNYNYDIKNAEYFESDLDKALYLADRDYKADTGESFAGIDKRLYFLQNYSYDTSSGKAVDKEVIDALIAYQKYIDEDIVLEIVPLEYAERKNLTLAYIDGDNIPELIFHVGASISDEIHILSYQNGNVIDGIVGGNYSSIDYAEKKNLFRCSGGRMGNYTDYFYSLSDGAINEVAEGYYYVEYDDEENKTFYEWNKNECSSEEDYYNRMIDFCNSQAGGANWRKVDTYNNIHTNILAAYDALRKTTYSTYEYCIYQFEVKDGILTVASDEGVAVSDGFGLQPSFSFSYPVAEDCIWEDGYWGGNGYESHRQIDAEAAMKYVKEWRNAYETSPDDVESPASINFDIVDDEVVRVYRATS